jgi:hypothetical protein
MNNKVGQDEQVGQTANGDDSSLLIACEKEGKHVVRKSFRVPIPPGLVTLDHGGERHQVKDLSMVLENVRITFPDKTFLVDVRIVHISAYEGDSLICGMEIIHTHDSGYIDWMTRVISEIKTSVLGTVKKNA